MDYQQQRQVQATAQKVGTSVLVVVVRAAGDVLKLLWKFLMEMGKSIVGK